MTLLGMRWCVAPVQGYNDAHKFDELVKVVDLAPRYKYIVAK